MTAPVRATALAETRFRAMGSDFHVIVVGGADELPALARARIDDLEAKWSRFRAGSELSRINRSAGRPVLVSTDTVHAVTAAVDAWRATGGRFDATVLPALTAAGYDRDFASLAPVAEPVVPPGPTPGCGAVDVNVTVGAVMVPAGVALDLGGIGKGLAADLVVTELAAAGALGACVNAGGDLRVWGEPPAAPGWVVDFEHLPGVRIALSDGAVATSSTVKRRWTRGDVTQHHLIDPTTGAPAARGLEAVTIVAGCTTDAEMLTKAAFVAGVDDAGALIDRGGATGFLVTDTGWVVKLPGIERFLV